MPGFKRFKHSVLGVLNEFIFIRHVRAMIETSKLTVMMEWKIKVIALGFNYRREVSQFYVLNYAEP